MAIENHFIHYSTIYLSRREEILVHSIIALYSSKDGFKWVNNDDGPAVIMVGSDIKNLNDSGSDPFATIKKEQVVCVLGDMFYPKNARAVIHIDLPIKALQLVDRLSEIERKYIGTEFSLNYVAANHLAKANSLKKTMHETKPDVLLNQHGTIDFLPFKSAIQNQDTGSLEKDEGVITHLDLFKTLDLQLEANPVKNEPKPFSLELVDNLDKEKVSTGNVVNLKAGQSMDSATGDALAKKLSTFSPVSETTSLKEEIRLVPPTLTDVVSEMPEAIARKIANDLQLGASPVNKEVTTNLHSVESNPANATKEEQSVSLSNSVKDASVNNINSIKKADTVAPSEKKPVQLMLDDDESPRIKLLRWPKADLIQQHPGNAILASMVINTPMSVIDMARQSDLPIPICQRFFDAVVAANVAEYVDRVTPSNDAVVDQWDKNEDVPQRKGILYRIRAALGLVRK